MEPESAGGGPRVSRWSMPRWLRAIVALAAVVLGAVLLTRPTTALGVLALLIGAGMILLFWLMTGLYIRRANGEFDDINSEIIKGAIE